MTREEKKSRLRAKLVILVLKATATNKTVPFYVYASIHAFSQLPLVFTQLNHFLSTLFKQIYSLIYQIR